MAYQFPEPKDPSDILDYTFDWSAAIPGSTIINSSWVITGADQVAQSVDGKRAIVRIGGGSDGTIATIQNTITDSIGQILQRTANLRIKER